MAVDIQHRATGRRKTSMARVRLVPGAGAITVNPRMRTPHEGVWAAGDCVEARHVVSGLPVNYHLGTIANKQGRVCGINIGDGYATFPGVAGTAVSKICVPVFSVCRNASSSAYATSLMRPQSVSSSG